MHFLKCFLTYLHIETAPTTLPLHTYQCHKREKRRSYEQRIQEVEHGSITPLVFVATGGMGKASEVTYKRLFSMLAVKTDQPYSQLMNTIKCLTSFSLEKSQIRYIRGSRSSAGHAIRNSVNVIISAGHIPSA